LHQGDRGYPRAAGAGRAGAAPRVRVTAAPTASRGSRTPLGRGHRRYPLRRYPDIAGRGRGEGRTDPAGRAERGETVSVALVLASSTGGIGTHVASLADGLAARGTPVTVLGPALTQDRFDFTSRGARFIPIEVTAAGGVMALRRALASLHPDVV